jgi:enoyl-CoA hydratase
MSTIRLDMDGAVAIVTIDRPPANALTKDFFAELATVLPSLGAPAVRAAVLTGSGRFFSAGLDLFEVFAYPPAAFDEFTRRFDAGFRALFACPTPIVAAVNGHAIAGGAVLAAAADFRLMADGPGRIGLTEILVGLPFPASILEIVRQAWGGRHLVDLVGRGRTYLPAEAETRGLVDEVVPAESLAERARALAQELAGLPAGAFGVTKTTLRARTLARIDALEPGRDPVWDAWRSPPARSAVEAYRARTLGRKA